MLEVRRWWLRLWQAKKLERTPSDKNEYPQQVDKSANNDGRKRSDESAE